MHKPILTGMLLIFLSSALLANPGDKSVKPAKDEAIYFKKIEMDATAINQLQSPTSTLPTSTVLLDEFGNEVADMNNADEEIIEDISALPEGTYYIRYVFTNGVTMQRRIILY